jgi:hypothetical protein
VPGLHDLNPHRRAIGNARIPSKVVSNQPEDVMARILNCLAVVVAITVLGSSLALGKTRNWTFDNDTPGGAAQGFKSEFGTWTVVRTDAGNVLAQSAKSLETVFNLTLVGDTSAREVDMSVRMKATAGTLNQGGGVVWRALDSTNYYLCRYDPLANNICLYKVIDGKKWLLQTADLDNSPGWHTIGVTMDNQHIDCYFDGRNYLSFDDASLGSAGKIGLWTEADAQTQFQDLTLHVP